jgi:NhaP-type Na+/H+ and K+/H+ antiporters
MINDTVITAIVKSDSLTQISDTLSKLADTITNPNVINNTIEPMANASNTSSKVGLTIAIIGLLIFAAHLFSEIFSRKRLPDVLLLLFIGLIIGPLFGWIKPENLGTFGSVFSAVTLVVILFESGTQLSFNSLLTSLKGAAKLTVLNFFVTTIVIGLLGWLFFKVNPLISFMVGAILGGTSSAVVIPMVQQLKISSKSSTILILESAFSDVLCIVFALALLQAITLGKVEFGIIFGKIFSSFVLATIMGLLGAIFWALILDQVRHIKNSILTTPAFVFIIYGINEFLGYSGAIAALAFGIGLANIDNIYASILKPFIKKKPANLNNTEKMLFGEIVFLLKTFFFIYIGISIQLNDIVPILIGLGITILLFILRVPIARISIADKHENVSEMDSMYMSAMVPKGLAAAVLATMPAQAGIPEGEMIKNIVFSVILFSIIFTSVLIPLIEKRGHTYKIYERLFGLNDKIKKIIVSMKSPKVTETEESIGEKAHQVFDSETVAEEMEMKCSFVQEISVTETAENEKKENKEEK